ncbi:MAG: PLP-dependent aspartate aminotransferase family protein [Saprospiraceae bacterium]
MHISDILTHLGEERAQYYNAVAPPIIQSSNFVFSSIEDMRTAILSEKNHHVYTRGNNPTVGILCGKIAALEKTEDAIITGSGASAVAGAVLSMVKAGDHIICVQKPYSWTYKLIVQMLGNFGVEYDFVDATSLSEIEVKIKSNTKVLYLESPNSVTFELQDLEACSALAKKNGIVTIIDNSHCSPLYQNPAELGIDIVVHSATKYLNGHSDVVAGVICGSKDHIQHIFNTTYMTLGLIISPHDASLILRGLRTLPIRLEKSNQTALKIAQTLEKNPKIDKVIYPFLPSFPQYSLAKKQMKGAGGLLTIQLKVTSKEQVFRFVSKIQHFLIAVSWGGYESLMIPSLVFHDLPGLPDSVVHWSFVRLYIGLEEYDYLIKDLEAALQEI